MTRICRHLVSQARSGPIGLVCGVLALQAACAPPEPVEAPDVLLVSIDTLRGDRWGCQGDPSARTPFADRLARTGRLFAEGRAPTPVTLPSHTTLMTGVPPVVHGVRDNAAFRLPEGVGRTLAEAFSEAGWTTGAFVSSFPLMSRFGLDRGFSHYDDRLQGSEPADGFLRERPAAETVAAAEAWVREAAGDPEVPLFLWVHFFDPHAEYRPPGAWAAAVTDPYRGEIAFTDRELGRLLGRLADLRSRPRVVAVVADHGESLGQHDEMTHGVLAHLSTLRIPIVISPAPDADVPPGWPVPLAAVPASLLEFAGLPARLVPESAAPVSERPSGLLGETLYPFFNFGWSGLRVLEEGTWRLVAGPVDRLYRTDTDPGERRDLADEEPDRAERMRRDLESEWARLSELAWRVDERSLSAEELESLRALGYLGGEAGADDLDRAFDQGDDPGERVRDVDRLNAAIGRLNAGELNAAIAGFERLVAEDGSNRLALEYLGRAYLRASRPQECRAALRRALELGRNPVTVYFDLAWAAWQLGDREETRMALEEVLKQDPQSLRARTRLGEILTQEGRPDEALPVVEALLEWRPRSPRVQFHLALIHEARGDRESARACWQRALDFGARGEVAQRARRGLEGGS